MKKLLIALFMMFAGVAFADTGTVTWYNEDLSSYETTTCTIGGDIILPTPPTKTGYTFVGWTSLLPDGYTQLEYVESTGTQYIDTGVVPQGDYRIELVFATTSFSSTGTSLFGTRPVNAAGSGIQIGLGTTGGFALDGLGTRYNPTTLATINTRYKYVWNNKNVTLTSGSTTICSYTFTGEETQTYPLVLNGLNNAGTATGGKAGIYLYSFKVWNGQGGLVMDLVPAVQEGTVPVVCMYDVVSGTFFTNAGTGAFIAGPVVQ